jgi:arginine decarboxylase
MTDRATPLSRFYNASQLRLDTWNRLKLDTARLAGETEREEIERLRDRVVTNLSLLEPIESFWAFPGFAAFQRALGHLTRSEFVSLARLVTRIERALIGNSFRRRSVSLAPADDRALGERRIDDGTTRDSRDEPDSGRQDLLYFEVVLADTLDEGDAERVREGLRAMRRPEDRFVYEVVIAPSFEDALVTVLINPIVQACVLHDGLPAKSRYDLGRLAQYLESLKFIELEDGVELTQGAELAGLIAYLRPELDCYLMTDLGVEELAGNTPRNVRRVFYAKEDYLELHLNILRGINDRYKTPFFTALKEYSTHPTGVFHAMPISRGKSITKSHWIRDVVQFYGINIFLAETSATSGGLDSLLDPQGPIKRAQERAARAFGARQTFFVTNGTSTANKIVLQAMIQPDDIVLVDHNCHKSHHYGFVLSGARVRYLDSYPLDRYSMYGAVALRDIKKTLLEYKRAGTLDQVKMLLLTNCTFDGIVYNVERIMQECLAIKPDLIFLWDEAWFAFARFDPVYRQRTAMESARRLRSRYRGTRYRKRYDEFRETFGEPAPDSDAWLDTELLPDPDRVRIRVYATQSTHKTLSSLRQGSMIHVYDQDFAGKSRASFDEAYMTHTSTSPNYQIVASLDAGRRQVELEGFELVQRQKETAMLLRERITNHPELRPHFEFLTVVDMIPERFRPSGLERYYDSEHGWSGMMESWASDEFVLDPCRLTLSIGRTGIDGDTFKNEYLMRRHGIQINKTSRNTVLFMTNIGTSRSSVAYLIEVLVKVARELEEARDSASAPELRQLERRVHSLTEDLPPLPDFSEFHPAFRPGNGTSEGDIRSAFFLAAEQDNCEYLRLDDGSVEAAVDAGRSVVSSKFVIPYPPGFPLLVPGQVVSKAIVEFMRKLDVKEIHGYEPELGLSVFRDEVLAERVSRQDAGVPASD